MIASRLSLYLAIALFLSSLCLPAVDGAFGIQIIFAAILGHILLIGIPFAFPAWANLLFYLVVKKYFQHEKQPKAQLFDQGLVLALLCLGLMLIGILMGMSKSIQIGALVWLLSGVFLLLAFVFQKMPTWVGVLLFLILLSLSLIFIPKVFNEAVHITQYQSQPSSKLATTLFNQKQTDLPVPKLTQVAQNHQTRNKGTGHSPPLIDQNAVDLSVLKDQRIEVQFDEWVQTSLNDTTNTACQMGSQQQYFIHYPKTFWENGYEWHHPFYTRHLAIAVGHAKENNTAILYRSTRLDDRHTRLELINKENQQILYTQDLLIQPFKNGCLYLPTFYAAELESAFKLLLDERPAFEVRYAAEKAAPQYAETLTRQCQWEQVGHNEYLFENKKIRIMTEKRVQPHFLCSKHYVAIAYLTRVGNQYTSLGEMEVTLFNRDHFDNIYCNKYRLELNVEQQGKYQKQELFLERIKTQYHAQKSCSPFQFYFSDGSMQEQDY